MQISEDKEITFEEYNKFCNKIEIHKTESHIWDFGKNSYYELVCEYCQRLKRNVEEIIIFYDLLDG